MPVRPRGSGWQADVQYKGARHRETFDTEKEATDWEEAARAAVKRGHAPPKKQTEDTSTYGTIQKLVTVVTRTKWNKPGAHQMVSVAERFTEWVGPAVAPKDALTQANVDTWIAEVSEERQLTGATINRYLSALSVLVKRAMAAGLIPRKLDLSWQAESEARLRWFSEEEDALIAQTLHLWGLPDWQRFFVVCCDTGGRNWTEVASLGWEDITPSPRMVGFWKTKNYTGRTVPLTSRAAEAIEQMRAKYAHHRGPFTHLDKDTGRRVWERLREHQPALKDTVWYTCRHTFASRLVQRGANLYYVQRLMGHKSIKQTERYAKLAPANLIETVGLLEPGAAPRLVVNNAA